MYEIVFANFIKKIAVAYSQGIVCSPKYICWGPSSFVNCLSKLSILLPICPRSSDGSDNKLIVIIRHTLTE